MRLIQTEMIGEAKGDLMCSTLVFHQIFNSLKGPSNAGAPERGQASPAYLFGRPRYLPGRFLNALMIRQRLAGMMVAFRPPQPHFS